MSISNQVKQIPGKPKIQLSVQNQQLDLEGATIEPPQKEIMPTKEMTEKAQILLKAVDIQAKGLKMWGHNVPTWNKKWEKDDVKKKQFQDDYAKAKNGTSHIPKRNKEIIHKQSEELAHSKTQEMQESQSFRDQRKTIQQQVKEQQVEKPIVMLLDTRDIYSGRIVMSYFLQFFCIPFDFKQEFKDYLKQFKTISEVNKVSAIYKQTKRQMILFHPTTAVGHQRMKQLQKASQFNQQTLDNLDFLIQTASGNLYIPDDNFDREYELLKPDIKSLVTMKVMDMGGKVKPKLFEVIPCGESVDSIAFATEELTRYKIKIHKEYQNTKTWNPFFYYRSAQEYAVTHPKSAGKVSQEYVRCGYEIYLYKNVEKVLLFLLINLLEDPAIYHDNIIECNANELIQLVDKFRVIMARTAYYTKSFEWYSIVNDFVDNRWQKIIEVAIKTKSKKIAMDKVKKKEEMEMEVDEELRKEANQEIEVIDTSALKFTFKNYVFDYASGSIYKDGEAPPEPVKESVEAQDNVKTFNEETDFKKEEEVENKPETEQIENKPELEVEIEKIDENAVKEEPKTEEEKAEEPIVEIPFVDPFAEPEPAKEVKEEPIIEVPFVDPFAEEVVQEQPKQEIAEKPVEQEEKAAEQVEEKKEEAPEQLPEVTEPAISEPPTELPQEPEQPIVQEEAPIPEAPAEYPPADDLPVPAPADDLYNQPLAEASESGSSTSSKKKKKGKKIHDELVNSADPFDMLGMIDSTTGIPAVAPADTGMDLFDFGGPAPANAPPPLTNMDLLDIGDPAVAAPAEPGQFEVTESSTHESSMSKKKKKSKKAEAVVDDLLNFDAPPMDAPPADDLLNFDAPPADFGEMGDFAALEEESAASSSAKKKKKSKKAAL